ncbi:MAG: hypothetical protein HXX08_11300 [Chloroflexi bacterium]|uniref:Uncharacterized protein n=1 Tax=Candidatus Chlorohelix allophototropha TaxID=3003348 RepID=A0A8T7M3N2_9CHLR|nr:hypothetical protein [Chloroflexota bacterium]WJW65823.1 hypothetical protein OZ401_001602 [Chloroflexota bacterium L227-S17]
MSFADYKIEHSRLRALKNAAGKTLREAQETTRMLKDVGEHVITGMWFEFDQAEQNRIEAKRLYKVLERDLDNLCANYPRLEQKRIFESK